MIVILLVMMSVICVLVMDILAVVELAQPCIISKKGLRGLILLLVLMVVVVVVGRMTPGVL